MKGASGQGDMHGWVPAYLGLPNMTLPHIELLTSTKSVEDVRGDQPKRPDCQP